MPKQAEFQVCSAGKNKNLLGTERHKGSIPERVSPLNCAAFANESSKIRINLYHSAEAANGKTANPKKISA